MVFPCFRCLRAEVAPTQDEEVRGLPEISLDDEGLMEDDSDVEQTAKEKRELATEARCGWWEVF